MWEPLEWIYSIKYSTTLWFFASGETTFTRAVAELLEWWTHPHDHSQDMNVLKCILCDLH